MVKMSERSKRSIVMDRGHPERGEPRRSQQPWERGRGAPKIGNPRYTPVDIMCSDGVVRKYYVLAPGNKRY